MTDNLEEILQLKAQLVQVWKAQRQAPKFSEPQEEMERAANQIRDRLEEIADDYRGDNEAFRSFYLSEVGDLP
jgi:hypothetical protein